MNTTIVLITGQMRSGTSAVAEVVHRLGFPVAVSMYAPAPPTFRPEWEDVELVAPLTAKFVHREGRIEHWPAFFAQHFRHRRHMAERLFGTPSFAAKSPLLAFVLEEAVAAAKKIGRVVTIQTLRDPVAISASMAQCKPVEGVDMAAVNERIGEHLDYIRPDMLVQYEDLVENPATTVLAITNLIGAHPANCCDAARSVLKPTCGGRVPCPR